MTGVRRGNALLLSQIFTCLTKSLSPLNYRKQVENFTGASFDEIEQWSVKINATIFENRLKGPLPWFVIQSSRLTGGDWVHW